MLTDKPEVGEDNWQEAGAAWSHAGVDWALRFEPYARDAIEELFSQFRIGPDVDLLDVACGAGYALGIAERRGARTAGIDASAELIELARRRTSQTELIVGSMFALPWPDASFDVVTSFNGIWGGCDSALREAHRVLRTGGRIGFTFWGRGAMLDLRDYFIVLGTTAPGGADEMKGLATIGAPGVAEEMLSGAGFELDGCGSTKAILEMVDDDEAWRCLRSPGLVVPSLRAVGEGELRRRVMAAIASFRAPDGSYRLVNELVHVVGVKRG
jgi:SAM-dependent methyltransferase